MELSPDWLVLDLPSRWDELGLLSSVGSALLPVLSVRRPQQYIRVVQSEASEGSGTLCWRI